MIHENGFSPVCNLINSCYYSSAYKITSNTKTLLRHIAWCVYAIYCLLFDHSFLRTYLRFLELPKIYYIDRVSHQYVSLNNIIDDLNSQKIITMVLHWNGLSPLRVIKWLLIQSFVLHASSHWVHWFSFSTICILRWTSRCRGQWKDFTLIELIRLLPTMYLQLKPKMTRQLERLIIFIAFKWFLASGRSSNSF